MSVESMDKHRLIKVRRMDIDGWSRLMAVLVPATDREDLSGPEKGRVVHVISTYGEGGSRPKCHGL